MKSSTQIRFDYEQTLQRANDLDDIAEELKRLSNKDISNTLDELSGGWKGESAQRFQTKARRLQGDVTKSANKIYEIAESIRNSAKILYEAEMEAWRIANQRNYGGNYGSGGGNGETEY